MDLLLVNVECFLSSNILSLAIISDMEVFGFLSFSLGDSFVPESELTMAFFLWGFLSGGIEFLLLLLLLLGCKGTLLIFCCLLLDKAIFHF